MAVVDTSFYVTTVDVKDPLHAVARSWLGEASKAGERLFAPWILVAEVGAAISRGLGDPALARKTVARLVGAGVVHLIPVDARLAERASDIAIDHRIRGCDAVYVALAEALGEPLATFDTQQSVRAAGVVRVLRPGEEN
jgi:predicted nucleic acid-binding protein